MTCLSLQGGHKDANSSFATVVCVNVCERQSQSTTVIMETSSPVISNISFCSQHSEHHLSVPLPEPDLQLDGHTTTRSWH